MNKLTKTHLKTLVQRVLLSVAMLSVVLGVASLVLGTPLLVIPVLVCGIFGGLLGHFAELLWESCRDSEDPDSKDGHWH